VHPRAAAAQSLRVSSAEVFKITWQDPFIG
jgi:hypothetical protein